MHAPSDDRALEQVAAELGEDPPAADLADAVPGAADALQAAGDGLGRLDLQDEVDGAHVDAELERGGGDEAGQLAGLQQLLDLRALLARERAVVGARDLAGCVLPGELVQAQRDALGRAAVVDEDDRRVVLADEPQQLGIDRRPDRVARGLAAGDGLRLERIARLGPSRRAGAPVRPSTRPAPRSAGRAACATPASMIVTSRCGPTRKRPISSSGFWVADRPIRWTVAAGRPTRAWASRRSSVSARCEPRLVAATAWISSTITASTPLSISRAREVSIR